jgi:hypothetical protein
VIPEEEYPIKKLNEVHEIHEKQEDKHVFFVPFVFFVENAFGRFILVNPLRA